jgi:preprotein translocase subunit SecA
MEFREKRDRQGTLIGFAQVIENGLIEQENQMQGRSIKIKIDRLIRKLNGSTIEYDLSSYQTLLNQINGLEKSLRSATDRQLQDIAGLLQVKTKDGVLHECDIVQAFALVREAASRVMHLRAFDVQILGALAMNKGRLAEMQTGEGKTLTAVLPAFVHGLSGEGVHVLTFNDYLARRDAQWMGPVYHFLNLTTGCVQEGMSILERQKAYAADVTYLTAKEAGFDYLRDSLCYSKENTVHRPFHFAIIDEADSILIDEARIPLVIAAAADDYVSDTHFLAGVAKKLSADDFEFDEYSRNIILTDAGQKKAEGLLNCGNLFAEKNVTLLTRLNCALHAELLLHRDVDYIVRKGKIELVDEFTGRVADRRRWPDGLQAALEAKENLDIQSRGTILNSITLQHFLQLYPKICGMTATAQAAEEEFKSFYNLDITVIPPNKPCVRIDRRDVLFASKKYKTGALIKEIDRIHQTGRPILVGTRSVQESVSLAAELKECGIHCHVLNAKNDEDEAGIIAEAGGAGAVTISTNMAGRGTDIRLGGSDEEEKQAVISLGGLYVIGTNKHESQRIDKQLRGRSGRQGDPGSSRFFISLEDDLFIKYRLSELLPTDFLQKDRTETLQHPIIRNEIDRIQRICEGQNLEIKKTLCKYSSLIEKQRQVLFKRRQDILFDQTATEFFRIQKPKKFAAYAALIGEESLRNVCNMISLYHIDTYWSDYIAEIADIREGIHLKRLGGQDPFHEFQKLALQAFDRLLTDLEKKLIQVFNKLPVQDGTLNEEKLGIKVPTATWTYLVNDNPFENILGLQLIGNTGLQVSAGILWPLMILQFALRKKRH